MGPGRGRRTGLRRRYLLHRAPARGRRQRTAGRELRGAGRRHGRADLLQTVLHHRVRHRDGPGARPLARQVDPLRRRVLRRGQRHRGLQPRRHRRGELHREDVVPPGLRGHRPRPRRHRRHGLRGRGLPHRRGPAAPAVRRRRRNRRGAQALHRRRRRARPRRGGHPRRRERGPRRGLLHRQRHEQPRPGRRRRHERRAHQVLPRLHRDQLRRQGHRDRRDRLLHRQRGHGRRRLRRPDRARPPGLRPALARHLPGRHPGRPAVPERPLQCLARARLRGHGGVPRRPAPPPARPADHRHRQAGLGTRHQRRHRRGHRPARDDGRFEERGAVPVGGW